MVLKLIVKIIARAMIITAVVVQIYGNDIPLLTIINKKAQYKQQHAMPMAKL